MTWVSCLSKEDAMPPKTPVAAAASIKKLFFDIRFLRHSLKVMSIRISFCFISRRKNRLKLMHLHRRGTSKESALI